MKFVLLWSPSQKKFHIQTIGSMISDNMDAYKNGMPVDYITLAVAETFEDAAEIQRVLLENN